MCVLPANAINIFRVLDASKTLRFQGKCRWATYDFFDYILTKYFRKRDVRKC